MDEVKKGARREGGGGGGGGGGKERKGEGKGLTLFLLYEFYLLIAWLEGGNLVF